MGDFNIPRIGDEVLVAFMNCDRPIIVGSLYNNVNNPPYDLPAEAKISGFKMPGYKLGFNDKSGAEKIFFQAKRDYAEYINNHSRSIIKGNKHKILEDGDHHIEVLQGSSKVSAAKEIQFSSEYSSLTIDPAGILMAAPTINLNPNSAGGVLDGGLDGAVIYDENYDSLGVLGLLSSETNDTKGGFNNGDMQANATCE